MGLITKMPSPTAARTSVLRSARNARVQEGVSCGLQNRDNP
uniref:Uncharacterized protein LOC8278638 n=1 Tax=Rhizophora mucronata TaxID=61149 RepID=A0A2P2QQH2_RHIMU